MDAPSEPVAGPKAGSGRVFKVVLNTLGLCGAGRFCDPRHQHLTVSTPGKPTDREVIEPLPVEAEPGRRSGRR